MDPTGSYWILPEHSEGTKRSYTDHLTDQVLDPVEDSYRIS